MATTVTKIIDPDNGSGTHYTSLSAWEAAEQGDLTGARDEIAVAKCRCTGGTADTAYLWIDGWTTDATRYIMIWTDPSEGYRHSGTYPSSGNKYRLYLDTGGAEEIRVYENYTRFIGIATKAWNSGDRFCIRDFASNCLYDSIVCCGHARGYSIGIAAGGNSVVVNCFSYDLSSGFSAGSDSPIYMYNCTARNCTAGFLGHWTATVRAKNCLADSDCTTGFSNDFYTSGCSNNAAADSTAPGTSSRSGSASFSAAGYPHLAASDTIARGYGVNLHNDSTYAFQTDIDRQDRGGSGASWDIGADEYVAGVTIPRIMHHLRQQGIS